MTYYIPPSGSVIENARVDGPLMAADALLGGGIHSAESSGTYDIHLLFDPVTGISIDQFESQVRGQSMVKISMGCYYQGSTRVVRHRESNRLWLLVGQTGFCAYFKLHEEGTP